jgi:hypothetical protein
LTLKPYQSEGKALGIVGSTIVSLGDATGPMMAGLIDRRPESGRRTNDPSKTASCSGTHSQQEVHDAMAQREPIATESARLDDALSALLQALAALRALHSA